MRKTIALIELASHNEVLSNYCRILHSAGFRLVVFTNTFNRNQISLNFRLEWVVQQDSESTPDFIHRVKPQINEVDLILFTTIEREFKFFSAMEFIPPKLLVLHKLVMFVNPRKRFLFNRDSWQQVKDLVKIARFYLLRENRRNLRFLQQFHGLVLPSFTMESYLRHQGWEAMLPPHFVMDFAIHERPIYRPLRANRLLITIPGIISEKSRDYEVVIKAFEQFKPAKEVELVLMGKPKGQYGHRVISRFLSLQSDSLTVRTYTDFVEQEEFDDVLQRSDLLILPIAKHMKVSIFKEINGYTCVSGNINDMFRFGTPSLVPAYYPLEEPEAALIEAYHHADDLAKILDRWIREEIYLKKRANVQQALASCTPHEIGERIKAPLYFFMHTRT